MPAEFKVCTMAGGDLCAVSLMPESNIVDLKGAIAQASGVPVHEQRLVKRAGWEIVPLQNQATLGECGLQDGGDVTLVRQQPFNGTYEVSIEWNGRRTLQILGTHAKLTDGETGFEAEIEWQGDRTAAFSGRRFVTTSWSLKETAGQHQASEGVREWFTVKFNGDEGANGFGGIFQRQYEGELSMTGEFLGNEAGE